MAEEQIQDIYPSMRVEKEQSPQPIAPLKLGERLKEIRWLSLA